MSRLNDEGRLMPFNDPQDIGEMVFNLGVLALNAEAAESSLMNVAGHPEADELRSAARTVIEAHAEYQRMVYEIAYDAGMVVVAASLPDG